MSTSMSHKIGLATATIIGMNAMIGSGIFTAPAALASNVGPAGILAYIFVAIAIWFMADSLARLAKLYPEEGSFYTYAKQWGGHIVGMIAIIGYFIGLLVAMGLLVRVSGSYLSDLFPSLSGTTFSFIVLTTLIILNMFGVGLSKLGQHILIVLTVFPILAISVICFSHAHVSNLVPFAPYGFTNVMAATSKVIFGFFGFECAASLYNIVKDPEKNVPRALTYAILLVSTFYILFVFSIILATPQALFATPDQPITDIIRLIFPGHNFLVNVLHLSILSAIIGTVHSMIWTSSHLLLLLVDKIKSPKLHALRTKGVLNERSSVLIVGLFMGLSFITLQNVNLFFYITALSIVLAYLLSMITLLIRRSEWKSGNNIKTVIGFITALTIFYFAAYGLASELFKLF